MAELRDNPTVGNRTTRVVEEIAVSSDEEVLRLPTKDATSSYTLVPNVTASQSKRIEPNGHVGREADSKASRDGPSDSGASSARPLVAPRRLSSKVTAVTTALSMTIGGAVLLGAVGTAIGGAVLAAGGALVGAAIGFATSVLARQDVPPES
jgi:hypothetical protein